MSISYIEPPNLPQLPIANGSMHMRLLRQHKSFMYKLIDTQNASQQLRHSHYDLVLILGTDRLSGHRHICRQDICQKQMYIHTYIHTFENKKSLNNKRGTAAITKTSKMSKWTNGDRHASTDKETTTRQQVQKRRFHMGNECRRKDPGLLTHCLRGWHGVTPPQIVTLCILHKVLFRPPIHKDCLELQL